MKNRETGIIIDIDKDKTDFRVVWDGDFLAGDFHRIEIGSREFIKQIQPISQEIYTFIMKIKSLCHGGVELRKICAQNIILVGEGALIPETQLRLKEEIQAIELKNKEVQSLDVNISVPSDPLNAVWMGRSQFGA